jgi:uncharacterized membrane protein
MTEGSPDSFDSWTEPGANNAKLVYILYLLGFVLGITGIVGLVFAYINRGKSEAWVDTHYTYQIRTFWIGLLYGLISMVLVIIGIGFLLFIAVSVWVIVRCVIGLQKAAQRQPVDNPLSWFI